MTNPFDIPVIAQQHSATKEEQPEEKMGWGATIISTPFLAVLWLMFDPRGNFIVCAVFVAIFGGGLIYAFNEYESSQYYRDAEITSFVKDDDGQYHFSVVYESGWVQTFHDMSGHKVCVYRKDVSKPTAKIPYTKWHTVSNDGNTAFSNDDKRSALIYLPRNFKIELFDD